MFRAVWRVNVVHIALIFIVNMALFVGRVGAPFSSLYLTEMHAVLRVVRGFTLCSGETARVR